MPVWMLMKRLWNMAFSTYQTQNLNSLNGQKTFTCATICGQCYKTLNLCSPCAMARTLTNSSTILKHIFHLHVFHVLFIWQQWGYLWHLSCGRPTCSMCYFSGQMLWINKFQPLFTLGNLPVRVISRFPSSKKLETQSKIPTLLK